MTKQWLRLCPPSISGLLMYVVLIKIVKPSIFVLQTFNKMQHDHEKCLLIVERILPTFNVKNGNIAAGAVLAVFSPPPMNFKTQVKLTFF